MISMNTLSHVWKLSAAVGMSLVAPVNAAVLKVEAESGALGASWTNGVQGATQFISVNSTLAGNAPTNSARVVTYTVTFPAPGTYDLYGRVRVGPGSANDDSFFYGNGFGLEAPDNPDDWTLVNSINSGGFVNAGDVVSGAGTAGIQVWKWVNFSQYTGAAGESPLTFTVAPGDLTQTFQIGAREDGLDLDAFVFGTSGYAFTVANLDAGIDGTLPGAALPAAVTVNWSDVRQVIDGFGASSAWRSTWNATVADRYFSTNSGLGLSLLRTRITPGGNTVENSIMQLAQARGARVWSAPWSPAPAAQFKSNGATNDGSFIGNATNYQAYASQLAGYVLNMKNQYGVALYALSIQNEPDANVTTYESCKWTAQQIHDFVPYLSSALAASNVAATKIMLPESQNWTDPQGLRLTTMNDAATAALVGIIANHNYVPDNDNGDQNSPAAINNYGKALWETEVSTFSAYDGSMTNGIYWAQRLHAFLTVAQVNAWHYWWLSGANNEGLADSTDVVAKRGYVLGQFSRFVRPNFRRLGVVTNSGIALVSAYRDTNSSRFAIVAINRSLTNPVSLTVSLSNLTTNLVSFVTPWITSSSLSLAAQTSVNVTNAAFTYTLPALSVVTFVGQTTSNSPPALAPVGNQTIGAGVFLTITNQATDPNAPPQVLTFTALNAPTNATLNATSGVVTWRPAMAQAGMTHPFAIRLADNGSPSLSATNSFSVTVNPPVIPAFTAMTVGGGQVTLTATGALGPDYRLLTSTNLTNWQLLTTSNSPPIPVSFAIPNTPEPQRYYRLQLGP